MIDYLEKSLTELEGEDWGFSDDESYVVRNCTNLRHKALKEFSVEDLRIMIGQNIGVKYLVPIALDILDARIFSEGMHYPGDLLCNVIRVNPKFYEENQKLKNKVLYLIEKAKNQLQELDKIDLDAFSEAFLEALEEFGYKSN